ncbi:hypothetical protein D3C75_1368150 [compost metagenome]
MKGGGDFLIQAIQHQRLWHGKARLTQRFLLRVQRLLGNHRIQRDATGNVMGNHAN